MSDLEQIIARKICEELFGCYDPDELSSPSSVSAQSRKAARAVLMVVLDAVMNSIAAHTPITATDARKLQIDMLTDALK